MKVFILKYFTFIHKIQWVLLENKYIFLYINKGKLLNVLRI